MRRERVGERLQAARTALAGLGPYMRLGNDVSGTTSGPQLALFYADHDRRLPEALRLAEQESRSRGGVYTDDALAWAFYKNGRTPASSPRPQDAGGGRAGISAA